MEDRMSGRKQRRGRSDRKEGGLMLKLKSWIHLYICPVVHLFIHFSGYISQSIVIGCNLK